jgi:hypothetical protein
MNETIDWHRYDDGASIGQMGSEEGVIVRDDEYAGRARITLEQRDGKPAPFAITCGLYGWFLHSRYCGSEEEARRNFEQMKLELGRIADLLLSDGTNSEQVEHAVLEAISNFVERYPT